VGRCLWVEAPRPVFGSPWGGDVCGSQDAGDVQVRALGLMSSPCSTGEGKYYAWSSRSL
jgi:hypothetical protein